MTSELTVEERVENGAKLLDEECPGWFERIEVDDLDIKSYPYCVLGQLGKEETGEEVGYFAYRHMARKLGFSDHWEEVRNGFMLDLNEGEEGLMFEAGPVLTNEWLKQIRSRINGEEKEEGEVSG